MWGIFRQHHYLSADFNKASKIYLAFLDNNLVGIVAMLSLPMGNVKHCYTFHRVVILPDYQGLGFGTRFIEFIADLYTKQGKKVYLRTSHVRLNQHCLNSVNWETTNRYGKNTQDLLDSPTNQIRKYKHINYDRCAYSFKYVQHSDKTKKILVIEDNQTIDEETLLKLNDRYDLTVATGKPDFDNCTERLCQKHGIKTIQLYTIKNKQLRKRTFSQSDLVDSSEYTLEIENEDW